MKNATIALLLVMLAAPAHAYVGPGAGAGAILGAVAVVLGILLLIVGFLWFPIKRYLRNKKVAGAPKEAGSE